MLDSKSKKKLIEQAKVARMRRKRLEHDTIDAPAHKLVEKALLETENIYRTLIEITGEGIVVAQDGLLLQTFWAVRSKNCCPDPL